LIIQEGKRAIPDSTALPIRSQGEKKTGPTVGTSFASSEGKREDPGFHLLQDDAQGGWKGNMGIVPTAKGKGKEKGTIDSGVVCGNVQTPKEKKKKAHPLLIRRGGEKSRSL